MQALQGNNQEFQNGRFWGEIKPVYERPLNSRRHLNFNVRTQKVEGANDVRGSLAERTNRLAKKETRKPDKTTLCVAKNIDSLVLEARVRNRGGSGQPPEAVAGRAAY